MSTIQIPICPITRNTLVDPVTCPDGHTYERKAIEEWLLDHNTSPMNPNKQIYMKDVVPNYALRQIIEDISNESNNGSAESNGYNNGEMLSSPSLSISVIDNNTVIFVNNPDLKDRIPRDLVCVIDISGSMGADVSIKTSTGIGEDHGLSVLDVVKHAVLTVASTLNSCDRMGIVTFDNQSYITMELTNMDQVGKTRAKSIIQDIATGGCTNLHSGISEALNMLDNRMYGTLQDSSVLLFTDGSPNIRPPRGEDYELRKYKDNNTYCPAIHLFGFSNSLVTDLMYDLADIGNGMFCYIPDASFVGTVFVNALSNILSTYTNNSTIIIDGNSFELGPLQYGQNRSVVLNNAFRVDDIRLSYYQSSQRKEISVINPVLSSTELIGVEKLRDAISRKYFIEGVKECINYSLTWQFDNVGDIIDNIIYQIQNTSQSIYSKLLVEDLNFQIRQSLSKEYFTTWGNNFVHSILRAHQLQYCNNFKDPGVQYYGGTLFHELQDTATELFDNITPPKPSNSTHNSINGPLSMSYYNDSSNPCFAGWSTSEVLGGGIVRVDQLVSGDIVRTRDGYSSIICVVKTYCKDGRTDIVTLDSGLAITPFHPIFYKGRWEYPKNIGEVSNIECKAVYSFVLEKDHMMLINGTPCICFGHGFDEGILQHHYYGTHRIIDDLKTMPGWNIGLIELQSGCIKVDEYGIVIGLVYNTGENMASWKILYSSL